VRPYDPKATLKQYLQGGRETLVWKLHGLSDYDVRRPLVPTGTNLLGLVKHKAYSEALYFGATFGRPWMELGPAPREPNAHMWATGDETREGIIELYRDAWAHADAVIDELGLDAVGHVPHWPTPGNEVTLHEVLVHVIVDTQRHAGHADIIRELIDGSVGLLEASPNVPAHDEAWWAGYYDTLQQVAENAPRD
jgi:Protein of unknown function (DUF664)